MTTELASPCGSDSSAWLGAGRAAILVISPVMLAELLQIPDGCHIDSATAPHDQPGVLHLRVRGAGWHTKEGELLQQVRGTVRRHHAPDGSVLQRVIDWGFQNGEAPNAFELTGYTGSYRRGRRTQK